MQVRGREEEKRKKEEWKKEERRKNNAKFSGHYVRPCMHSVRAHGLCFHQFNQVDKVD